VKDFKNSVIEKNYKIKLIFAIMKGNHCTWTVIGGFFFSFFKYRFMIFIED
jgi:hypothetical protein